MFFFIYKRQCCFSTSHALDSLTEHGYKAGRWKHAWLAANEWGGSSSPSCSRCESIKGPRQHSEGRRVSGNAGIDSLFPTEADGEDDSAEDDSPWLRCARGRYPLPAPCSVGPASSLLQPARRSPRQEDTQPTLNHLTPSPSPFLQKKITNATPFSLILSPECVFLSALSCHNI